MKHNHRDIRNFKPWLAEAGPPSGLAKLLGLPIKEAYTDLSSIVLVISTPPGKPNKCLLAEGVTVSGNLALKIEIGDMISDEPIVPPEESELVRVEQLEGLHLTGLDNNVLLIGQDKGIRFLPGRIEFVRKAPGSFN